MPPLWSVREGNQLHVIYGPHAVNLVVSADDPREAEAVLAFARNMATMLNISPQLSRELFTILPPEHPPEDEGA